MSKVYTSSTCRFISVHTFMYVHTKVTTTFHFEQGLIHLATLDQLVILVQSQCAPREPAMLPS
jgi:hypothetical protein